MIGIAGKILLLIALTGTALSGYAYLKRSEIDDHVDQWKRYGRYLWALSALASTAAFGLLIFLNVTHQFQYAYVYEHTSVSLPLDYLVAASWAGQEGSFCASQGHRVELIQTADVDLTLAVAHAVKRDCPPIW